MLENKIAIIPQSFLDEVIKKLNSIESQLDGTQKNDTQINSEFISEKDAILEFGKKTTWFWNQRQKGLRVYKMGNTPYYLKEELLTLIK